MQAKPNRKRCCFIALFIIILLAVAGILVYFFVPWENVVDKIPNFGSGNQTNSNEGDEEQGETTAGAPTAAPTTTPLVDYEFMQCTDVNNCCNGLEEICDLGVDDILWATSHNAMSTKEGGFIFGYNHLYNLEESLDAGYRAISLDVCNCGGDYQLCHGICTLGARSPITVFQEIVTFLNDHPSEIIMINLQVNSEAQAGGGPVSLETFANLLSTNVDGFNGMLYNHDATQASWPTLQNLKDLKKRLLLFHLNGPTSCANGACPDGFHYWFDYAAETAFDFASTFELEATTTSCQVTRGAGSTKDFLAVTSFVTPPDQDAAEVINARSFLESRIQACSQHNGGLDVNLLYVDFWSVGDLPEVVQNHNKALAAARRHKTRRMLRAA